MTSLNLIMSGAYVGQELAAEFGMIPPAFLPVGVGRLYDLQLELFKRAFGKDEIVYLTLPESFEPSQYDRNFLKEKNVSLLFVPDDKTLGEAIIYAVNMLVSNPVSVRVLNGDTMFERLPADDDCVVTHEDSDDYSWAVVRHRNLRVENFAQIRPSSEEAVTSPVACGFFSFSSSIDLIRSLVLAKYNFVDALNIYNNVHNILVVPVNFWYDFGHLQNYFHSRRLVTTARSFNSMEITKHTVKKSSADHFKMSAEAHWLRSIPESIQPYTVRIFGSGMLNDGSKSYYSTDYQYAPNLAELFVFSKLGRLTWNKILTSCVDFLHAASLHRGNAKRDEYLFSLVYDKTNARLNAYAENVGFDLDHPLCLNGKKFPSMRKIVEDLQRHVRQDDTKFSTVMHGDFCFSNILYNSRTQRISVIDPRGYVFPGEKEIYGDIRYDIAKLSHSIIGFYDLIVAGRYSLRSKSSYEMTLEFENFPVRSWLKKKFSKLKIAGISTNSKEIRAITALLFVSMLPLHADRSDRQRAFIANAIRLYSEIEEGF